MRAPFVAVAAILAILSALPSIRAEETDAQLQEELCFEWETNGDDYMLGISCAILELNAASSVAAGSTPEDNVKLAASQAKIITVMAQKQPSFEKAKVYMAIGNGVKSGVFLVDLSNFTYRISTTGKMELRRRLLRKMVAKKKVAKKKVAKKKVAKVSVCRIYLTRPSH